ncbi:MAG: hypothetical protein GX811_12125, partial [Lentisphaerae bacterium]|nr:hypothetical protein [Lentisphaerota bacterium]
MMSDSLDITDGTNSETPERLAAKYGMAFLENVPDECLDASLVEELSVDWARDNLMLPIVFEGKTSVLVADPLNVNARKYLVLLLGYELEPVLSDKHEVLSAIE